MFCLTFAVFVYLIDMWAFIFIFIFIFLLSLCKGGVKLGDCVRSPSGIRRGSDDLLIASLIEVIWNFW